LFERLQKLIRSEKSPAQKRLGYILKLVITISILVYVFSKVDLRAAFYQASHLPFLCALAIFLLSVLRHSIQCLNWRTALNMNPGFKNDAKQIISSYLVALPLRFVIPGGHATFAKVFYLKNTSILASLIATTAERLFMSWATWTFAAIAAYFVFPEMNILLRLTLVIVTAFLPLWAAILMSFGKARAHLPGYIRQAPRMMLLQIANTLIMYLQYYIVLNYLGVISALDTWLGISLTNLANSIPVTISGLGLREGFAIHFLENYGFSPSAAVAATLSVFFFHDLIPAFAGGIVLIRAKRKN
jgi:hypothetical protein